MYKIALALIAVLLFAACHGDGIGMEWDAGQKGTPSVSSDETGMEELIMIWYGPGTTTNFIKEIVVNTGRLISVNIDFVDAESAVVDSCAGSVELTEEDYQNIITYVNAADLMNYEPPTEGDEDCVPTDDPSHVVITYKATGDVENTFDTGYCQLEESISNIAITMNGLANNYVTDCTEGPLAPAEEDDTSGASE
ncbi:MAG: hypothetical protein ABH871_00545 [Pseudomonadota bacterium]